MASINQLVQYDAIAKKFQAAGATDTIPAAAVPLASAAGNALSHTTDGVYVPTLANMNYNPVSGLLTVTMGDGTTKTVTLAAAAADKFLNSTTYDSATKILTLTMSDSSSITVDMSDLVKIDVSSSATATVSGDGTSGTPLSVAVKIDPAPANKITITAGGLMANPPAVGDILTATIAPVTTTDGTLSVDVVGANTYTLTTPDGWLVDSLGRKIPYWN